MTLAGLFTGRDGYVITRHAGDTVVNILIDVDNHLKLLGKMKGFCCLVVRTKGFDYSTMIALADSPDTLQALVRDSYTLEGELYRYTGNIPSHERTYFMHNDALTEGNLEDEDFVGIVKYVKGITPSGFICYDSYPLIKAN